ncbi:MAG: TRAP transporter small permease [Desulfobacterales bacterium]|nr:TRAP transporter small permease [Desulfobacterales bacterium]
MKMFWNIFKFLTEGLSVIMGYISALCIVAAALIITEGVFVRKVLDISTIWQTEMCVFLLIFATFMGTAFVQKHDNHLNVDFLLVYLSPKVREFLLLFGAFFTMALSGIIAWYAWPMWWKTVVENYHSMSLWGPPLWIPYFFIPFGLTLMVMQYIVNIVKKIIQLKAGEYEEEIVRAELKDIDLDAVKPK